VARVDDGSRPVWPIAQCVRPIDEPALLPEPTPLNPVHRPVLLNEVVAWLMPREGAVLVDGTVGAGGHAAVLAAGLGTTGRLIGLDRDPEMLALAGRTTDGLPVTLVRAPYSDLGAVLDDLRIDAVDGILLDLGLSSDQLAWAHRGFSFGADGPLDMRYDPEGDTTAAGVINTWSEEELARLFFDYGEERHSRRVARRIVEARRIEPIATTGRLAEIVRKSIPGKWGPIDPATRVFQALRIAVNAELEHLDSALDDLADWLKPGGRAAVLSFHSLEDRRVKVAFRDDPRLAVLTRKPVVATAEEVAVNPRARSAKLRVAERCPNLVGPPVPPNLRSTDRSRRFDR
jgi:16S rRNA (cytosine1402-N4)-methyltransferase